jgi:hypothetical protein
MVPHPDLSSSHQHRNRVLIDVSSVIGAEDFILSQNRRAAPADPFARQCFAEIVQSVILMEDVYVAHPILTQPRVGDFGEQPRLLRLLLLHNLVKTLQLDPEQSALARESEDAAFQDLVSDKGLDSLSRFVRQARVCDGADDPRTTLSARLRGWSDFQEAMVHLAPDHHSARIPTSDGIEEDAFGQWARALPVVFSGALDPIVAPPMQGYVMATLGRSIKYRARAGACGLFYQSHPMRRDFLLTFEMTQGGADSDSVLDLVRVVRGIQNSLMEAGGTQQGFRLRIQEFELPLLGGRLWKDDEAGERPDSGWLELVVDRISQFRQAATDLRNAIGECHTDEDYLRLSRDIEDVKLQLLRRLNIRGVELSPVERELVQDVASVSQAAPGLPILTGLYVMARTAEQRMLFPGKPFQRFLYKEFVKAWKRSAH